VEQKHFVLTSPLGFFTASKFRSRIDYKKWYDWISRVDRIERNNMKIITNTLRSEYEIQNSFN